MINRVNDMNLMSDDSFEKLATLIKQKDQKKLYKICKTNDEAEIAIKELKIQGYNSAVEKLGNNINVYKVQPETIELEDAKQSNNFKKLAWGRYCFQKQNSINGFDNYNFDDGSIWKVIIGEDGKEYLVKEVDDNDEDKVKRVKSASLVKHAEYTSDLNVNNIMKILYGDVDSEFVNDILSSNMKQNLFTLLDEKINTLILEATQQNNITNTETIENLKNYMSINISNNTIMDSNSFNNILSNRISEILSAMEIL